LSCIQLNVERIRRKQVALDHHQVVAQCNNTHHEEYSDMCIRTAKDIKDDAPEM